MGSLDFSAAYFLVRTEMEKMHLLPEGASVGERLKKAWCKFRSQSPLQLFGW